MSSFHSRITGTQAQSIWASASQQGFIKSDTRSLLVHDLGRLADRLKMLNQAFPNSTLHAIAIKANPLVEVLKFCVANDCGLEAASIEEVQLAIAANCPADQIVFDSPAKTDPEIDFCLQRGIHLNANGFDELDRIAALYHTSEHKSQVGLRINPEISSGAIGQTSVGNIGSKFGVSINSQRCEIVSAFERFNWLSGLHVHVGSQGCSLDQLCEAAVETERLRREIVDKVNRPIEFVDIGGGLPAIYDSNASSPSPSEYVQRLQADVPSLFEESRLVTEFGRCVHAGCGIAFSRVEYVLNRSADQYEATLHLGADFLLRPVYRSAEWKHEFFLLNAEGQLKTASDAVTTLNGPLCFGGDVIARDLKIGVPEAGDWIAIRDCGAYTLSMWSRHCSRGMPAVAGYRDGEMQWLRGRETPEDMVRYWSQ